MMGSPQILRMSCYISRPKDSECIHIFTYIDISLIIYVGVCIKSMGQPGHCKFQTACPDHHHCMIWASAQDQRLVFSDDLTQIYIYIYLQYIVLMQICFLHWGFQEKKKGLIENLIRELFQQRFKGRLLCGQFVPKIMPLRQLHTNNASTKLLLDQRTWDRLLKLRVIKNLPRL